MTIDTVSCLDNKLALMLSVEYHGVNIVFLDNGRILCDKLVKMMMMIKKSDMYFK